jgi:hypothetical protein
LYPIPGAFQQFFWGRAREPFHPPLDYPQLA